MTPLVCQLRGHTPVTGITAATLLGVDPQGGVAMRADGRRFYCGICATELRGPLRFYALEDTLRGRLAELPGKPVKLLEPYADRINRRWWLGEHSDDYRLVQAWVDLEIDRWGLGAHLSLEAGHGWDACLSLTLGPLTLTIKV